MQRRIHIAEGPLARWYLPAGMQEIFVQQQLDLILGEIHVDERYHCAMEGKIPGSKPWVLPGVGHGNDVIGVKMSPIMVAPGQPRSRRYRLIAFQPRGYVIVIKLLVPDHPGQRLAENP